MRVDDARSRIVLNARVPVVTIAVNHDSAQRLMLAHGLHVADHTSEQANCVRHA